MTPVIAGSIAPGAAVRTLVFDSDHHVPLRPHDEDEIQLELITIELGEGTAGKGESAVSNIQLTELVGFGLSGWIVLYLEDLERDGFDRTASGGFRQC